ncbi:MAG: ParB N-terminal domain-containing protein [Chlamydiota bacterium]|nr:ParB N-terminal domain-containing protein [Chlamydiota bacterium]
MSMVENKILIENYPIDHLSQLEAPFDFSAGPIPEALKKSISHIGILNPICVLKEASNILITGKRRLLLARELQFASVPVRIFSDLSELDAFHIHLFENLHTRILNPVEIANIIYLLTDYFNISEEILLTKYCLEIGIAPKKEQIERYKSLYKSSDALKEKLINGFMTLDSAYELMRFPEETHHHVMAIIQELRLGVNSQKEFFELVWEISKKSNCTIFSIIDSESFNHILGKTEWSTAQRWAKLQHHLKTLRFPILLSMESDFQTIKKSFAIPPRMNLHHPVYFESNDFRVQFSFRNKAEFDQHLFILQNMSQLSQFSKLFQYTGECEIQDMQSIIKDPPHANP